MTEHEIRIQCLELAIKRYDSDATDTQIENFAEKLYQFVTKKSQP